jgi:Domain of unknown function (DUF4351)
MLGLSLEETRVYQEASAEGRTIGRQEGEQAGEARLVLRLLTRRIGDITPDLRSQIQSLSLTQLESLGEALLDFSQPDELAAIALLNSHKADRSAEVDDGKTIAIYSFKLEIAIEEMDDGCQSELQLYVSRRVSEGRTGQSN